MSTLVYAAGSLREVQRRLAALKLYVGRVDNDYGDLTKKAIEALFNNQRVEDFETWEEARRIIAASQALCRMDGIEIGQIDGLKGPQTTYAFSVYDGRARGDTTIETWRDSDPGQPDIAPHPENAAQWPRQADVRAFFGPEGANQASITLPYPMRIAWNPNQSVTKFSCNTKVVNPLKRIFKRTLDHYGYDEIKRLRLDLFGGCLNVRKMRGGSNWSMHAYGIAVDIDPEHNQLKYKRAQATLDAPTYDKFWEFVEAEGAVSLGRTRDYDWMHFQFARL